MSGNIFRPEYRELSEAEKAQINVIKSTAQELYDLFSTWVMPPALPIAPSREISLAKTKLEESVMWAVKAITGPLPGTTVRVAGIGVDMAKPGADKSVKSEIGK